MAEREEVYNSKIKYGGIFSYKDFYKFCYDWLIEEVGVKSFSEKEYEEKISGNEKEIKIKWEGTKEITDYFRMDVSVTFEIQGLTNVEINEDGAKVKTNKGKIKISVKGALVRDYKGKFETTPFLKFLRAIYEKYVVTSRVDQFEGYVVSKCDGFLGQAKAYLDLEGKR